MMGRKERSFAPLVNVSLEELVPQDHFYRHLDRTLDLSFVREFVQETYAGGGRPSIDPVVFFKLQLVMFFEGLRSERQLMRHAADRLSVRWYVGYDLGEPLPDHSSLTRIRERYGVEVFRRFFEQIVQQCLQAGLVWGKERYVDATKVKANASMDSLKPRFAVEAHVSTLFSDQAEEARGEREQDASQDEPASPEPSPQLEQSSPVELPTSLSPEQRCELSQQNEARHDWIEEVGAQDRSVKGRGSQRIADLQVSTTDPDATIMLHKDGSHLGYQTHYVVDGVLPLVVVDNSAFSPSRLTALVTVPILASQGSSPSFPFQTARILMTLHVFVFVLLAVVSLLLLLVLLWKLDWFPFQPCSPKGVAKRSRLHRYLLPRTPDAGSACRLASPASSSAEPASAPVRPWSEVKSRRGAPKRIPTEGFACPNPQCRYFGNTDARAHALVGDGKHGRAERIQTFRCQACRTTFSARRDTPLYRLKTPS